jgi:predicted porin
MNKLSFSALVAAGLLAGGVSSASAADLGGNCCADLEERIAELEATTARKGNRKVSLTVSGWVGEQVTYWDDGDEQNAYVSGLGSTLSSHFKMTGQASIVPGWAAGYVLHVEVDSNEPRALDADTANSGSSVIALQSFWFLKSDDLGKVSVGKQSMASDNAAILVDGSGSLVPANWVQFEGNSFFLKVGGVNTGLTWNDITFCQALQAGVGGDCNGVPLNAVRYDSPTFGGFSLSAGWGEDDVWDVAARYAGEFAGFKLAAAVAYMQTDDEALANVTVFGPGIFTGHVDTNYLQAALYIQHVPTGLFAYGAYGREETDDLTITNGVAFAAIDIPDAEVWYIKAGIRQRWTPLGHTVLYGLYGENDDKMNPLFALAGFSTNMTQWGGGIVQEIDAAAMSVWLQYQRYEGDISVPGTTVDFDELDMVKFGALINF